MSSVLDIDLYQARMLIGYFLTGMENTNGIMEAYCRKLPNHRQFLVTCGIDRILDYLRDFKFTDSDIEILQELFPEINFKTTGLKKYLLSINPSACLQINAMTDGQLLFANEPVIQITGPIGLIQYIEKKVLSILNHDIRIASKAARVVMAANPRPVFEFGGRRANDCCAASIARAAYIAGCASSSSVAGFQKYNVPCSGTMGHVWIMSHPDELTAFKKWNEIFRNAAYLVDTYDSINGTKNAMADQKPIKSIRLDSGDIADLSVKCRDLLNSNNYNDTKIIASDDLNEYKIRDLINKGAKIDAFGVGTEIVTSPDAVSCGFIYKLVAIQDSSGQWRNVMKKSSLNKQTYPGKKYVYRNISNASIYTHDIVTLEPDQIGIPLLQPRNNSMTALECREVFANELIKMPDYLKAIDDNPNQYHVIIDKSVFNIRND